MLPSQAAPSGAGKTGFWIGARQLSGWSPLNPLPRSLAQGDLREVPVIGFSGSQRSSRGKGEQRETPGAQGPRRTKRHGSTPTQGRQGTTTRHAPDETTNQHDDSYKEGCHTHLRRHTKPLARQSHRAATAPVGPGGSGQACRRRSAGPCRIAPGPGDAPTGDSQPPKGREWAGDPSPRLPHQGEPRQGEFNGIPSLPGPPRDAEGPGKLVK